jgi:hypothetical protein
MARRADHGSRLGALRVATHSAQADMIPSPSSLIVGTALHG